MRHSALGYGVAIAAITVHIMAAVAEHERKLISDRTKAALAAAKRRGVRLGGDRGGLTKATRAKSTARSVEVRYEQARKRARDLVAIIERIKSQGITSAEAIAKSLNAENAPTPSGRGKWQTTAVRRVLQNATGASR